MNTYLPLVISGFTIGMAYAIIPGPVTTESARRGVTRGFRPAWEIQMGALVGDFVCAFLGITGAVVVLQRDSIAVVLGLVGAGLLFSLARSAFRATWATVDTSGQAQPGHPLKVGMLFSLANPAGLAFWTGVGGGLLSTTNEVGVTEAVAILASYMAGAAVCGTLVALVASLGGRLAGATFFRWINALCGTALSWFGVRLLWSSIQRGSRWLAPALRAIG